MDIDLKPNQRKAKFSAMCEKEMLALPNFCSVFSLYALLLILADNKFWLKSVIAYIQYNTAFLKYFLYNHYQWL